MADFVFKVVRDFVLSSFAYQELKMLLQIHM